MNIKKIQEKVREGKYEISYHAEKERYNEDISILDIENVIENGEIIEDYPDDKRGHSCLILGYSNQKPIHIVCGNSKNEWLRIITVYLPRKPKWINELTRNKEIINGT